MSELDSKIEYPDTSLEKKFSGKDMYLAPQPTITPPSVFTPSTGGLGSLGNGDSNIVATHTQQIADIENVLIKLGLLRHR